MKLLLGLALAALDPSAGAEAPSPPTASAPAAQQEDSRIAKASDLIHQGKPADAIPILDGMIAEFEKAHPANGDRLVYSASTPTQTIYYMALSAALKKDGIVVDEDWGLAYFLKAFALIDLGRSEQALAPLNKAIALSPADAQFLAERGEWYKSHQQWDKSFADFKAAADGAAFSDESLKARHKARALRGMGFARIEQGDLKDAERLFRESLQLEPGNDHARSELEYIRSLQKK